jgi:ADP-heptose:LPS heptosyltransferase
MKLLDPNKNYKVLVLQTGRIGDLILLLPVFETLKKINPKNEVHLLASRHNYQAVLSNKFVDKVVLYEKGIKFFSTICKLRQEKYDVWIDPKDHKSGESRVLAMLSGAMFKIGFESEKKVFDYVLAEESTHPYEHISYVNMLALQPFGIQAELLRPKLFVPKETEIQVQSFLNSKNISNYYCINLSGSNVDRTWQTEKWISLLKQLPKTLPFVIIASPMEKERAIYIASEVENAIYLETKSIVEVFAIVANTNLVITPDTSIVHISAAFDKPLLALYVNAKRFYSKFYPLNSNFEIIMEEAEGAAVAEIPVEKVLEGYTKLQKKIAIKS